METVNTDKIRTAVLCEVARDVVLLHRAETAARAQASACMDVVFDLAEEHTGAHYDRPAVLRDLCSHVIQEQHPHYTSVRTAFALANAAGIPKTLAICERFGYTTTEE